MNDQVRYSDEMDPDTQVSAEEMVAAIIWDRQQMEEANDNSKGFTEEAVADLGREILKRVLLVFRRDLFDNA